MFRRGVGVEVDDGPHVDKARRHLVREAEKSGQVQVALDLYPEVVDGDASQRSVERVADGQTGAMMTPCFGS